MSSDFAIKKPNDLTKINTNDLGELLWWSYYFGTSPEHLLCTIQKFGNTVKEVVKHIKG